MPETAQTSTDSTRVITTVLSLALQAVSAKAVVILALVMCFSLFAWCMATPSVLGLLTAISFGLIFLVVFLRSNHASQNG